MQKFTPFDYLSIGQTYRLVVNVSWTPCIYVYYWSYCGLLCVFNISNWHCVPTAVIACNTRNQITRIILPYQINDNGLQKRNLFWPQSIILTFDCISFNILWFLYQLLIGIDLCFFKVLWAAICDLSFDLFIHSCIAIS